MRYIITAPRRFKGTTVTLPASKSISNRALVLKALCDRPCTLGNLSDCDDTAAMLRALDGSDRETIDIGAAGTAMRFLTAYFAGREGRHVVMTGSERMRHRPIGVLVDALRRLGGHIRYAGEEGFPPLDITGQRLHGGTVEVDGSISSQYISALLMLAPTLEQGLTLRLTGDVTSVPYIRMTLGMMSEFGVGHEWEGDTIRILPQEYRTERYAVEADWSAASYWYEIASLTDCRNVRLKGLNFQSWQGDADVTKYFDDLGIITEFKSDGITLRRSEAYDTDVAWDLGGQPDLAQTLIVTCCALNVYFDICGLHTLRIKETDRIAALQAELRKLGYVVGIDGDDRMTWHGERCAADPRPVVATYDDHRMAMAFAPLCAMLKGRSIIIDNPCVVSKSYPAYWDDLRSAGFQILETN